MYRKRSVGRNGIRVARRLSARRRTVESREARAAHGTGPCPATATAASSVE